MLSNEAKLRIPQLKWVYDDKGELVQKTVGYYVENMVVMAHYRHGIVVYLARKSTDASWYVLKSSKPTE